MDKVLAFSILSASPADIDVAAGVGVGGRWARLSWRRSAVGGDQAAAGSAAEDKPGAQARQRRDKNRDGKGEEAGRRGAPRFAPEFDGIDCFESIVSH